MSERIDDPTFKANDYGSARNDNFSFGSHIYQTTDDWLNPDTGSSKPSPAYQDITRPSTPEERQEDAARLSAVLGGLAAGAGITPHPLIRLASIPLGAAAAYVGTKGGESFGSSTTTEYDPQRWLDKQKNKEAD